MKSRRVVKNKMSHNNKQSSRRKFDARLTGPAVPKSPDYSPTRSAVKPPGFAEIEAASQLTPDSDAWVSFVRDVAQMPLTMTAPIQDAVQNSGWKISPNPMATIRKAAYQAAKRSGKAFMP